MNYQDLLNNIIGHEGRYVNNPSDRGGETIWGITLATARAFGYAGPMKDMPRSTAFRIYEERYWLAPGFNRVGAVDMRVAEELADTGVNMGPATAVKFLQRALNTMNQRGKQWPDIGVDGVLGAMTLAAFKSFVQARGQYGLTVLLRMMNAQQTVRYMEIAERDVTQEDFVYGWVANRTA